MIYYCIIPKNILAVTISHIDFKDFKKIKCYFTIRNIAGKILSEYNTSTDYPFYYSIKNNYFEEDTYLEIAFLDNKSVIEIAGTIDVFYKTKIGSFAIGTGCLSRNANSIEKKEIKSNIVKNCCFVSNTNTTKIFIINPNPLHSMKTCRKGMLDFKILNENGEVVYTEKSNLESNEMLKIDIKQKLFKKVTSFNNPLFYTFVAENNFNVFPITFMINNNIPTGCEHSQPQFNYFRLPVNGPQNRKVNIMKFFKNYL